MLWFYENLEVFVFGLFVSGLTLHFVTRRWDRQNYLELQTAYENALHHTRETRGDPAAVVRLAELHRAFMRSRLPGWFDGFGRCIGRWLKLCVVFTLVAFFFRGPIMRGEEEYARKHVRAVATDRAAAARTAKTVPAER